MRRKQDQTAESLMSGFNQIKSILKAKPDVRYHDWTGNELVINIKIPPGNQDMREMAAEWIASSIKNNMGTIINHAIQDVQETTMRKIQLNLQLNDRFDWQSPAV